MASSPHPANKCTYQNEGLSLQVSASRCSCLLKALRPAAVVLLQRVMFKLLSCWSGVRNARPVSVMHSQPWRSRSTSCERLASATSPLSVMPSQPWQFSFVSLTSDCERALNPASLMLLGAPPLRLRLWSPTSGAKAATAASFTPVDPRSRLVSFCNGASAARPQSRTVM